MTYILTYLIFLDIILIDDKKVKIIKNVILNDFYTTHEELLEAIWLRKNERCLYFKEKVKKLF